MWQDRPSQNVWTDFQHRRLWPTQGLGLPLPGVDDDAYDYDDVDEYGACGQLKDQAFHGQVIKTILADNNKKILTKQNIRSH